MKLQSNPLHSIRLRKDQIPFTKQAATQKEVGNYWRHKAFLLFVSLTGISCIAKKKEQKNDKVENGERWGMQQPQKSLRGISPFSFYRLLCQISSRRVCVSSLVVEIVRFVLFVYDPFLKFLRIPIHRLVLLVD